MFVFENRYHFPNDNSTQRIVLVGLNIIKTLAFHFISNLT